MSPTASLNVGQRSAAMVKLRPRRRRAAGRHVTSRRQVGAVRRPAPRREFPAWPKPHDSGSMNGTAFKLATYAGSPGGGRFRPSSSATPPSISPPSIPPTRRSPRGKAGPLTATDSLAGLLEGWDHNFPVLQEMVAFIEAEGIASPLVAGGTAKIAALRAQPPIQRPGKIFNAAQNFQEHVDEMLRAGMTPAGGPQFTGAKSTSRPYLFFKAPACWPAPSTTSPSPRHDQGRLGGPRSPARSGSRTAHQGRTRAPRPHRRLHDHQRRLVPRPSIARTARPAPFSGRSAAGHDISRRWGVLHARGLRQRSHEAIIRLTVNGAVKQDGNTSQFIYTPEEQIEYASSITRSRATFSSAAPAAASR